MLHCKAIINLIKYVVCNYHSSTGLFNISVPISSIQKDYSQYRTYFYCFIANLLSDMVQNQRLLALKQKRLKLIVSYASVDCIDANYHSHYNHSNC